MSCHRGHIDCGLVFKLRGQFSWYSHPEGLLSEGQGFRVSLQEYLKRWMAANAQAPLCLPADPAERISFLEIAIYISIIWEEKNCLELRVCSLLTAKIYANLITREHGKMRRGEGQTVSLHHLLITQLKTLCREGERSRWFFCLGGSLTKRFPRLCAATWVYRFRVCKPIMWKDWNAWILTVRNHQHLTTLFFHPIYSENTKRIKITKWIAYLIPRFILCDNCKTVKCSCCTIQEKTTTLIKEAPIDGPEAGNRRFSAFSVLTGDQLVSLRCVLCMRRSSSCRSNTCSTGAQTQSYGHADSHVLTCVEALCCEWRLPK